MLRRCGFRGNDVIGLSIIYHFPPGFFSNFHDFRQRDPLYPLPFVIVMKALSIMIYAMMNGVSFKFFNRV